MDPLAKTYEEVRVRYLQECLRIAAMKSNPAILKTDLYNESAPEDWVGSIADRIPNVRLTAVEIDSAVVAKAQSLHPGMDFRQGDIRRLDFPDASFDIILELSTIDHIPPAEAEVAMAEYRRVLKPGGIMLLFVWVSPCHGTTGRGQWYFDKAWLNGVISRHFSVLESYGVFWEAGASYPPDLTVLEHTLEEMVLS